MTRYRCIVADPPWLERGGGKSKRGADRHYPLMPTSEILSAMRWELLGGRKLFEGKGPIVADSAHLWLWVTDNFLEDGLRIMRALGFDYKRTLQWVKERDGVVQVGLGQYARGAHEMCLFGTRGKAQVPPPEKRPPSVLFAPRTQHSRKPDECYAQWFEAVSPGPRLEMFARRQREGWDVWGNEVESMNAVG